MAAVAALIVPVAVFLLAEQIYGPCFLLCQESEDLFYAWGLELSLVLQAVVMFLLARPWAAVAAH